MAKSKREKAQFQADAKVCRKQRKSKGDKKGFWTCMREQKAKRLSGRDKAGDGE